MYGIGDSYSISEVLDLVAIDIALEVTRLMSVGENDRAAGALKAVEIIQKHKEKNYG